MQSNTQTYVVVDTMSAEPVLRDPMTGQIRMCRTPAGEGWVLVDNWTTVVWEKREYRPTQQQ